MRRTERAGGQRTGRQRSVGLRSGCWDDLDPGWRKSEHTRARAHRRPWRVASGRARTSAASRASPQVRADRRYLCHSRAWRGGG
eukprot:1313723-Pleurochrysis_carterae.AAC.1